MFIDPRSLFLAARCLLFPGPYAHLEPGAGSLSFPPIGATPADRTPDPEPEPDVWLGEN